LPDRYAESARQLLRKAGTPPQIGGKNGIETAEVSRLRRGLHTFELRLLGRIEADQLRPYSLVTSRIMILALFDGAKDLIESCAGAPVAFLSRGGFRSGARCRKPGSFLGGERAPQSGQRKIVRRGIIMLIGELGVCEGFDAWTKLAQKKVPRQIKARLPRLDQQPPLDLQPDITMADRLDHKIRPGGRAVADDTMNALGLEPPALPFRFESAPQRKLAVGSQFFAFVASGLELRRRHAGEWDYGEALPDPALPPLAAL